MYRVLMCFYCVLQKGDILSCKEIIPFHAIHNAKVIKTRTDHAFLVENKF